MFLLYLNRCSQLAWRWPVTAETCSQISPNCNYCILFDVCCVLTVHNILYRFDNTQRDGLSRKKIQHPAHLQWLSFRKTNVTVKLCCDDTWKFVTDQRASWKQNSCVIKFPTDNPLLCIRHLPSYPCTQHIQQLRYYVCYRTPPLLLWEVRRVVA